MTSPTRYPTSASRRALFVVATAFLAAGCAANEISIAIVQNQAPQPGATAGVCTTSPDPMALSVGVGTLDLLLRDDYIMSPLYRSELLSTRDPASAHPETRGFFVTGARIDLRVGAPPPDGPELLTSGAFSVTTSTFVPPGTSSGPGYAVGGIDVIPVSVGQLLLPAVCPMGAPTAACPVPPVTPHPLLVIASITPFGQTMGGLQIEGATFQYPINVCCGCLITFPADADNQTIAGPDCSGGVATTMTCSIGQDEPVDCRVCSGSNLFCQPANFGPNCTR
jgi:hypothetical protein